MHLYHSGGGSPVLIHSLPLHIHYFSECSASARPAPPPARGRALPGPPPPAPRPRVCPRRPAPRRAPLGPGPLDGAGPAGQGRQPLLPGAVSHRPPSFISPASHSQPQPAPAEEGQYGNGQLTIFEGRSRGRTLWPMLRPPKRISDNIVRKILERENAKVKMWTTSKYYSR